MKTLVKLVAIVFLMVTITGVFGQTYETHSEFPKTHNNSVVKNPVARCSTSGHLATSGRANDGAFTYAGTTVPQWNPCVMVSDSLGAELFVVQVTAVAGAGLDILGISFDSSNENLLVLLAFLNTITVEGSQYTSMGEQDMLLIIYNDNGVHQDTYHIGGTEHIVLNDVDVAPNGEYRLVGSFENDLWIDGVNTTAVATGNEDFLLLSLNSNGYVWSHKVGISGGAGDNEGYSIVCDDSGNNYCAFHFYGSNVDIGNGIIRTVKGARDLVVAKYSNTGVCQMVFQFGGSSDEHEQGHIALFGTKVFFQGRVASANSFYCVNADNSIFSTFSTITGDMRNSVCAWMDFSTGMILSSGRMLSSNGDINIVSVAITNDTAHCTSGYGGTLTIDDGFGNNTVTFTGGGIGWAKIAIDGIATAVHQFDASTIAYGTLSDPGANRVYVALRGGTNVDLDPDPNVTVPLPSDKRGIAKYDCNPVVGSTATINLSAGWTWFSLNIENDDMSLDNVLASLTVSDGDYIKNQTSSATYYDGYGWYGALTEIDPVQMYQINLASSDMLEFTGEPANITTPINLNAGWTWIGYLPQTDLDINTALSSLTLDANDYIKNQTSSATYYDGYGWYGALEILSPYGGYKIKLLNASVLTYPATTTKQASKTQLPKQ